jgi:hypothetical protein
MALATNYYLGREFQGEKMPLVRGHHAFDDHFTQIPNDWVRDSRLSLKSIGLLAQLMSHSPGWNMSIRSLAKANGTGIDTIKSAVLELEHCGYLKRGEKQKQNEDGTFADYVWTTADPFQNPVTAESRHGRTEHKEEHSLLEEQVIENNERTIAVNDLFNEFYAQYPRKIDPRDALKAFKSALKRATFEDIIAGVIRYAEAHKDKEKQYLKYPASWLRADAWESHYEPGKDSEAAERSKQRRERELEASRTYLAELKAQEAEASGPKTCRHGKNLALCLPCSKETNA